MLDFSQKKKEDNKDDTAKKVVVYFLILVFGMFILFFDDGKSSNNNYNKNDENEKVEVKDIIEKMDYISNNYSLLITEIKNDKELKLEINTDGVLKLVNGDFLNVLGYVEYDKYTFIPSNDSFVISNKYTNSMHESVYDLDFMKNIISYCEFEDKYICKIKVSDYLNEYNNKYNTNYEMDESAYLKLDFDYNSYYVTSIKYDYTIINKIINNNDDIVNYVIKISNVGNNDFSSEKEYLDSIIKKYN